MTGGFAPVRSVEDLETLPIEDVLEGHRSAERGDPEPGPNRGRAFWHGWRTRMMDLGEIPIDDEHRQLTRDYVGAQGKARRDANRK